MHLCRVDHRQVRFFGDLGGRSGRAAVLYLTPVVTYLLARLVDSEQKKGLQPPPVALAPLSIPRIHLQLLRLLGTCLSLHGEGLTTEGAHTHAIKANGNENLHNCQFILVDHSSGCGFQITLFFNKLLTLECFQIFKIIVKIEILYITHPIFPINVLY